MTPRVPPAYLADCNGTYTYAQLANLWGVTRQAAISRVKRLRTAGYDPLVIRNPKGAKLSVIATEIIAAVEGPKEWIALLDGTRTVEELAEIWGISPYSVGYRLDKCRRVGLSPAVLRIAKPRSLSQEVSGRHAAWLPMFSPDLTLRQIADRNGLTVPTLRKRIDALRARGHVVPFKALDERGRPIEARPVALPEALPELPTLAAATGREYVQAFMRRPTAPHSPAVQAILDRLYGVAA